ncbi:glutathione S-transferase [Litorivicinus sp.]|nr:glutathione S-transferase [Litorivicinus sp.]
MELICSLTSPYARRVRVLAIELGIESMIQVTAVSPRESKDLWRLNPIGKVPTLKLDDGSAIFDSLVICDYLVGQFKPGWGQPNNISQWEYRTRLSQLNQTSDAGSQMRKLLGQEPPQEKAAWFQFDKIKRSITHINANWADFESEISLVTIGLGCTMDWLYVRFPEQPWEAEFPRIHKWFQEFKERPSMQQTKISG